MKLSQADFGRSIGISDVLVDKNLAGESELTRAIMKAFAKLPYMKWRE